MKRSIHNGIVGNSPRLEAIARQFLAEKHSTLFGKSYDLSQAGAVDDAVRFIVTLYLEMWGREADQLAAVIEEWEQA